MSVDTSKIVTTLESNARSGPPVALSARRGEAQARTLKVGRCGRCSGTAFRGHVTSDRMPAFVTGGQRALGRWRGRLRGSGARRPLSPSAASVRRVRTRRDAGLRHVQRAGGPGPSGAAARGGGRGVRRGRRARVRRAGRRPAACGPGRSARDRGRPGGGPGPRPPAPRPGLRRLRGGGLALDSERTRRVPPARGPARGAPAHPVPGGGDRLRRAHRAPRAARARLDPSQHHRTHGARLRRRTRRPHRPRLRCGRGGAVRLQPGAAARGRRAGRGRPRRPRRRDRPHRALRAARHRPRAAARVARPRRDRVGPVRRVGARRLHGQRGPRPGRRDRRVPRRHPRGRPRHGGGTAAGGGRRVRGRPGRGLWGLGCGIAGAGRRVRGRLGGAVGRFGRGPARAA